MIMAAASSMTLLAQRAYTLEECIGEAITNNVRIKNADNDIASAEHGKKEALTNYFPSVSASGAGFIANKGLLELDVAPGTSLDLAKDGVLGGISASMPIFTGGRIVNGNKLAQVNLEASRLQRRLAENEVRLTTERYFWQIVTLKEKLLTITAIETQLDTLSQDVETAVDAGLTNRNDLLQVRLRRNEMRSNRIAMENALSVLRRLLAQYMGHDADSIDVVHDTHGNRLPERPDAILALNDTLLFAAMKTIMRAGLRMPGDVALIGFSNVEYAEHVSPRLSTIEDQSHLMGETACQILIGHIRGNKKQVKKVIPTSLKVRESSCKDAKE